MDLNYNHLRYFRAVALEGNLTRAAAHLNLSQSALSVQIKALEDRLGHALFDRIGRRLELTEAGRIALDHAETIFKTGDELMATLRQTGRARSAIRVGALATLSRNFQLAFLRPLLNRSDVEIVLRSASMSELLRGLEGLALDVVLTNEPVPRDAATPFLTRRIAGQPVSLIGTPERRQAGDTLATLLAREPLILPTAESGLRAAFDSLASHYATVPQIAAEVDDIAMMRLLAREGAGLALLPPIAVTDELAAGTLVEHARLPDVIESFYAVTLTRRFPNPLVADLLRGQGAPVADPQPRAP